MLPRFRVDTEKLYEIAARELETDAPRKGLLAQAFAEAMGDEARTRAIYLRLRVAQLAQMASPHQANEEREQPQAAVLETRETREKLAASLHTPEACIDLLTRLGNTVREHRTLMGICWQINGPHTATVLGFESLREWTRTALLSETPATANSQSATTAGLPGPSEPARAAAKMDMSAPRPGQRASGVPNVEHTSSRMETGKRWLGHVMLVLVVVTVVKILFMLGHPNWGGKLAETLIVLIAGTVFLGGPAFLLGWLVGGRSK
jgi:hypothetical protein